MVLMREGMEKFKRTPWWKVMLFKIFGSKHIIQDCDIVITAYIFLGAIYYDRVEVLD